MKGPRAPTDAERQALIEHLQEDLGLTSTPAQKAREKKSCEGLVAQAAIAVFDDYISDGPGYAGSVMMVVWSGGPEIHEVFTWDALGILTPNRAYPLK